MYILKTSDGQHKQIGTSNGNYVAQPDGSFYVTGWNDETREYVNVGGFYFLSDAAGENFRSVEVLEIGGRGNGAIQFELNN